MRTRVPARLAWGRGRRRRLGAPSKGHRVGDIPLRRRGRILPGRPSAVTSAPFSGSRRAACLLARPRSELRQRLMHLALKPTPIHIGRWRPEPSQNLRHLAARKARLGRRAALGLIHHHRHNHHPFATACDYRGSLRWLSEPTVSSKRARCARCSSRASTTKLSRRSCRHALASGPRHSAAIATWPARPARGSARGDRAARADVRDRVRSTARPTGAWDGCARGRSLSAEPASRSISSRCEPTSPRVREPL